MEDIGPTASIIALIIVLFVEMALYGFIIAVQNVSTKEMEDLEENTTKKDKKFVLLVQNPFRYVNAAHYSRLVCNLVIGIYITNRISEVIKEAAIANEVFDGIRYLDLIRMITILITAGILFLIGIFIPKCIGRKYPLKWIRTVWVLVKGLTIFFSPILFVLEGIGTLLLGIFGIKERELIQDVSEDEIISMIHEGHEQGVFQSSEAQMITNIFEYTDKEAKDIMRWQKNIVFIDGSLLLKDVIFEQQYSRYPVYLESFDHVVGLLHIKDALKMQLVGEHLETPIAEIPDLLLKVEFIPETRNIDLLFKDMQSWKSQMVIVVDEYGQTSGLVAMEDILEEIVGNILDEYDEDQSYIEVKSDTEYMIDGVTPIEEVEEHLGITFPENEFDTMNGYLIAQMEHVPEENETFSYELFGYSFQVLAVENKMIRTILVKKIENEQDESEG